MRPLRLEIEGLTSFREKQVIDFTDLDLFVITGPTGSGKSSILDAIALALYGRAPRMGGHGNGELVSHGLTLARVQFEFNAQGETYRVARRLPRNGAQRAVLEKLNGDEWVVDGTEGGVLAVNGRIVERLGLDFGAFTRTVLLPQGDFSAFLAGDQQERRQILIRLLNLGRYSRAAQFAGGQATRLNAEATAAEHQLAAQYEGVSAAALAASEAERESARRARDRMQAAATVLNGLAADLTASEGQVATLTEISQLLAASERRITALTADFAAVEPEATAAGSADQEARTVLAASNRRREQAVSAHAETLRRTGDDATLADLDGAVVICAREHEHIRQLEVRRRDAEAEKVRAAAALDTASAGAADADRAEAIAAEADTVAQQRRDAARARLEASQVRSRTEQELATARQDIAAAAVARQEAEVALGQASENAAAAQAHLDHLKEEDEAAIFRVRLTLGEPCPVCRHTVSTIPVADAGERGLAAGQREAQSAAARHQQAIAAGTRAGEALRMAGRRLSDSEARLAALPPELSLADADRAFRGATEAAGEASQQRLRAAHSRRAADAAKLAAYSALATAAAACGALDAERATAEVRRRAALATIEASFPGLGLASVATEVQTRRQQLATARSAEATARTACEAAQAAADAASAAVGGLARRVAVIGARVMQELGTVGQLLPRGVGLADLPSLPEAEGVVSTDLRLVHAVVRLSRERIAAAATALKSGRDGAEARLRDALATSGLRPRTLAAGDVQSAVVLAVTEAAVRLQAAESTAARMATDLANRTRLEAEAAEKRRAANLNQTLATLLHANNFIDFILAESVQLLAAVASTDLKSISGGRYSLKARDIGFLVVDHANADEERSVSTLSGGETFLASLALATALARSVTDIAGAALGGRLEAMFIDEGFGTLDPEALDMVVDALERLRDTDRLVGIITHVAALSERIPDGLVVERTGNSSRVSVRR